MVVTQLQRSPGRRKSNDIFNRLKLHLTHPSRWITRLRAGVGRVSFHPSQLDDLAPVGPERGFGVAIPGNFPLFRGSLQKRPMLN